MRESGTNIRVLLVGETWVSHSTHIKGFDTFSTVTYHSGVEPFRSTLQGHGIAVSHLAAHDVPSAFPSTAAELAEYDVVMLSDIGVNSIQLSPQTWLDGQRSTDRLQVLADWVLDGGALAMAGGYLSFQGFEAKAQFAGTPVEAALPCVLQRGDDRVEAPQGVIATTTNTSHPILKNVTGQWPALLGYNRFSARDGATLLAAIGDDPLLAVREVGAGRSLAWASDIGPHWCPDEFTTWSGYGQLFANAMRWLGRET